jgi:DNA-binding transcriptional LysR family regulator
MDLDALTTFVKVVQRRSFSAAAVEVGVTPSSISKKITRLEKDIGARLINRSTRQVRLTEAGTALLTSAPKILHEIEAARNSVHTARDSLAGTMRIHLTPGTGEQVVLPCLLEFLRAHPSLECEISIRAAIVDPIVDGFDLSVRSGTVDDRNARSTSVEAKQLTTARYRIVATADYFHRMGQPRDPADLRNHDCLIYSRQPAPYDWAFANGKRSFSVRVSGHLVSDDWSVVHRACLAGLGISRLLTTNSTQSIRAGLVSIFDDRIVSERPVWAFFPRMRPRPKKLDTLLRHLQSNISPGQLS